jgi:hypothetical protein
MQKNVPKKAKISLSIPWKYIGGVLFLTSALDEYECLTSHPGLLTPGYLLSGPQSPLEHFVEEKNLLP